VLCKKPLIYSNRQISEERHSDVLYKKKIPVVLSIRTSFRRISVSLPAPSISAHALLILGCNFVAHYPALRNRMAATFPPRKGWAKQKLSADPKYASIAGQQAQRKDRKEFSFCPT